MACEHDLGDVQPLGPIPPELHSAYNAAPFRDCSICSASLMERVYAIQKVWRPGEVLFEAAICHPCAESVAKDFSEASVNTIKGFLLGHFDPDVGPDACHFCGIPSILAQTWSLLGTCRSDQILFPPTIVCCTCCETLQERLSRQTREREEQFLSDHFPGVPADLDFSPSIFGI